MKTSTSFITLLFFIIVQSSLFAQKKAVFIILDGIPADVLESVDTPVLDEIAKEGGYTRAWIGGEKGAYSESPTVSAVGYNHLLTGTWSHKHNVYGNGIKDPNYNYWNMFRVVENANPDCQTAIFSTWLDNRTKLIGEGLEEAGNIKLDYSFDGFEHDEEKFPHNEDRIFIFNIDEHVSKEAGRYIAEKGPDLSWVYLEFTDDMGHKYGDSPQMIDAVKKADVQVGRVWDAIKEREEKFDEEWMIVITTDHGRDPKTGKSHGGHSDRERTIWIITNVNELNERFSEKAAIIDIAPSILRFMNVEVPEKIKAEMDGVPFTGEISISDFYSVKTDGEIQLSWKAMNPKGKAEIFISETNHFKESGEEDQYQYVGEVNVAAEKFVFYSDSNSKFFKVVVKASHNWVNYWITEK